MISVMCWYIERDLDEDGREKFRNALVRETIEPKPVTKRHLRSVPKHGETKTVVTKGNKWKAPEGWTPPGWDPEKSYRSAMQFMSFQRNPK